ncbi:MAG TPA: hypothetical protein VIF83_00690, partial [Gemmatimonadaceae bacterium]
KVQTRSMSDLRISAPHALPHSGQEFMSVRILLVSLAVWVCGAAVSAAAQHPQTSVDLVAVVSVGGPIPTDLSDLYPTTA